MGIKVIDEQDIVPGVKDTTCSSAGWRDDTNSDLKHGLPRLHMLRILWLYTKGLFFSIGHLEYTFYQSVWGLVYGLSLQGELSGHIFIPLSSILMCIVHVSDVISRLNCCAIIYDIAHLWSSVNNQGQSKHSFCSRLSGASLECRTLTLWTESAPCYGWHWSSRPLLRGAEQHPELSLRASGIVFFFFTWPSRGLL